MQTFKSSAFIIVKNVIYGIVGGAVAALIASWFLELTVAIIIGAVLGLLIIYFAVVGDNIEIVVESDHFFVRRRGKVKYAFKTDEVGIHAKIRTKSGDSSCALVVTKSDGSQTAIDCSMLGASRFHKLLAALHVTDAPVEVKTSGKE